MPEESENIEQSEEFEESKQPSQESEGVNIPVQEAADSENDGDDSPPFAVPFDLVADLVGTTTQIVSTAASILEEELATGIRVTQNIEKKYVDVEKMRSRDPQEALQRFRKDAHDVVDILIDLVNVATNALGGLSERAISIGLGDGSGDSEQKKAGNVIPSLTFPSAVKPGEEVEIPMTLENESDQPTEAFFIHCADLVNSTGEQISAARIMIVPDKLVLEAGKSATVTVTVRVPEDATPGIYSGLLQATRLNQLRAVLSIQII